MSIMTLSRTNKHVHLVGQLFVLCLLELSSTCKNALKYPYGTACRDMKMRDCFSLIFTLHIIIPRCTVNHKRHPWNNTVEHKCRLLHQLFPFIWRHRRRQNCSGKPVTSDGTYFWQPYCFSKSKISLMCLDCTVNFWMKNKNMKEAVM